MSFLTYVQVPLVSCLRIECGYPNVESLAEHTRIGAAQAQVRVDQVLRAVGALMAAELATMLVGADGIEPPTAGV